MKAIYSVECALAHRDSRDFAILLFGQGHDLGLDEAFHKVLRRSSKHADAAGVGQ
jgi:hypothetical protein